MNNQPFGKLNRFVGNTDQFSKPYFLTENKRYINHCKNHRATLSSNKTSTAMVRSTLVIIAKRGPPFYLQRRTNNGSSTKLTHHHHSLLRAVALIQPAPFLCQCCISPFDYVDESSVNDNRSGFQRRFHSTLSCLLLTMFPTLSFDCSIC